MLNTAFATPPRSGPLPPAPVVPTAGQPPLQAVRMCPFVSRFICLSSRLSLCRPLAVPFSLVSPLLFSFVDLVSVPLSILLFLSFYLSILLSFCFFRSIATTVSFLLAASVCTAVRPTTELDGVLRPHHGELRVVSLRTDQKVIKKTTMSTTLKTSFILYYAYTLSMRTSPVEIS